MTTATPSSWYRHFWPWFLIGMLASAVTASLVSLYFAAHTTDVVIEHADASQ